MELFFVQRQHLATNIWLYKFKPAEPVSYIPGQYARFTFPFSIDDPHQKQHRTMTLVSHPTDTNTIEFVTRHSTPGSAYKHHLLQLKPGARMFIDQPRGDVVLPKSLSVQLVFVAGGIGLASFISMLRDVQLSGRPRTISLLYGIKNPRDKIFDTLLHSFPFANFKEYISPHRITVEDILSANRNDTSALYYLSGTEKFVESLRCQIRDAGLNDSQVIFDYFSGY